MATRAVGDTTQRELSYRKRLIEIANMINSASSIQDILVDIKDKVLDLVDAERVTIFALDTKNQELFSLFKAGQEVKEIRVPKTFGSIAGFAALSRKTANIKNAYDPAELGRLHPNLRFDARVNQLDVSQVLVENYKVPKEEIGKALAAFFNTPFWDPAGRTMPAELKERLTPEFLKRNMCAPIEKREGTLLVGVEDPYDLTRLDAIKAMNLAPRYDFVV